MDEIEGGILSRIPPNALALTLTRSTIRMQHSTSWRVDKANQVHDLIIALQGRGQYLINGERLTLEPSEVLIIPRNTRFIGWNEGPEAYLGIAQHFSLNIYGSHDLVDQMELRIKARLSRWDMLQPLAWHFRQSAPPGSVTLHQHHTFMVLLMAAIEDAFVRWKPSAVQMDGAEAIDLAVMKAASHISAEALVQGAAEQAVANAPYNPDYFQREFQKRIGRTPRKYQEFCRMERAMHLLESGYSVGATAAEVGYADPYYFSRMFKRTMGLSPRAHMTRISYAREGRLMQYDEAAQEKMLSRAAT